LPPVANEMLPIVAHALDQSDAILAIVQRTEDADGALIVRQVNGAFCRALGADFAMLEGRSLAAIAAPGQEDKFAALAAAAAKREAHRTELVCVRPDGTRLWLGFTLMPASAQGRTDRLLVMLARDITQQRYDAEQQNAIQRLLSTVFTVVEAGLAVVGKDGRFLITNAYHDRLLGHEPGSLTGRTTIDFVAPQSRDALLQARNRQFADRKRFEIEVSMQRADGMHLPVTMVSTLLTPSDSDTVRVVSITQRAAAIAAPPTQMVGKIHLISVDDGKSGGAPIERLMALAERIVVHDMADGDSYFRTKDNGFAISFGHLTDEEATFRSANLAREIRHQLVQAGEEQAAVEVSAIVAPLPAPSGDSAQRNAGIEHRIGEIEDKLYANMPPPTGAEGCTLEPVVGKERGPVLGYFVRAQWPPAQVGGGSVAARGEERFKADLAALGFAEKVALERLAGGNEAVFLECDFDCFFDRRRTQGFIEHCQKLTAPTRQRIVLLLAGVTATVAAARLLDTLQQLRPFFRAVGLVIDSPELPTSEAVVTSGTFVVLNAHVWDRSKAVGQARVAKLVTGLVARKTSLIVRGVPTPAARESLRDIGVKLFVGAAR
jgi:PAS domain S-box-containing protein